MRLNGGRGLARWVIAVSAAVVLASGSTAFGCGTLSELKLSSNRGPAGTRVTATGSGYVVGALLSDPVVLRWNGVDGPELARAAPDREGRITAAFTVPSGPIGYYVVVGVQRNAAGQDHFGTPSRASFELTAAGQGVNPTTRPTVPPATVAVLPTTTTTTTPPPTPPPTVATEGAVPPTLRVNLPPPGPAGADPPSSTVGAPADPVVLNAYTSAEALDGSGRARVGLAEIGALLVIVVLSVLAVAVPIALVRRRR